MRKTSVIPQAVIKDTLQNFYRATYFTLLMVSFTEQKCLSLMWTHLFIFQFVALAGEDVSTRALLGPTSSCLQTVFFQKVSGFWSYIDIFSSFLVYFCVGVIKGSDVFFINMYPFCFPNTTY